MASLMLASAAVKDVLSKLASLGWRELELLWDFKEDLEDMGDNLSSLWAVLYDANRRSIRDEALRIWLNHIKDAAYDIEDMMDDFLVQSQRWQKDDRFRELRRFFSVSNPLISHVITARKLKKMRERLKKISERRSNFHLREVETSLDMQEIIQKRETFSEVDESQVNGRDQDKNMIIEFLIDNSSNEDVSVISIVGFGGLGKTTLAKLVYNYERVKDNEMFHLRAWIYVSKEFDLLKIARAVLSVTGSNGDFYNQESARNCLRRILSGKRYLIVLDDIWEEGAESLDSLKLMLRGGARGSKIIVTTRSQRVAKTLGTIEPHHLKPLSEDDCWMLFRKNAFESPGEENGDRSLVNLGKEIAKECAGVPLVARVLGRMMRENKRVNFCNDLRNSEAWVLNNNENLSDNKILSSLKLSCSNMNFELQLCFSYCSIFPKGYEIDKEKLIQQWIALGFIKATQNMSQLVDIGEKYVNHLRGISLLQDFRVHEKSGSVTCKMHDLVHDLAQFVGGNEVIVANNNSREAHMDDKSHRYIALVGYEEPSEIYATVSRKVRALHFRMCGLLELSEQLFSWIENIRVLDISGCFNIDKLPASISKLEQLRYLDASYLQLHILPEFTADHLNLRILNLSNSSLETIPETIGRLPQLHFLDLSKCTHLLSLPISIGKLQHLQHLDLSECCCLGSLPESIGNLQNLQYFFLSGCDELASLPDSIGNLQNLQHLNLSGCGELESLPDSIGNLQSLQHLDLSGCSELASLPGSIVNLQNLQHLDLSKCLKLQELPEDIGSLFNLLYLNLSLCSTLEKLPRSLRNQIKQKKIDVRGCNDRFKPKLTIDEDDCRKHISIEELQYLSPSSVELAICGLENVDYPADAASARLSEKENLTSLTLEWTGHPLEVSGNCDKVLERLLPPSNLRVFKLLGYSGYGYGYPSWMMDGMHLRFPNLVEIELTRIVYCFNLPPLGQLPHLKRLKMRRMDFIRNIGGEFYGGNQIEVAFPSLEKLHLCDMRTLNSWETRRDHETRQVVMFPRLECLVIAACPFLRPRPCIPPSVVRLYLRKSDEVLSLWDSARTFVSSSSSSVERQELESHTKLENLRIVMSKRLTRLPEGMRHLQSLQTLRIHCCSNLAALPEWLGELTSLRELEIKLCPALGSLPQSLQRLTASGRVSLQIS